MEGKEGCVGDMGVKEGVGGGEEKKYNKRSGREKGNGKGEEEEEEEDGDRWNGETGNSTQNVASALTSGL